MKLFNLHIITDNELQTIIDTTDEVAYRSGMTDAHSLIEEARQEGYNEGKADGIKVSKRAFALAIKQKGESNNDIL